MSIESTFCNIPWKEVHINADGTYHSCGAQPNRISNTEEAKHYNVFNMSIDQWINSKHQCEARIKKLNGISEPLCAMCYREESLGNSSKRLRENLKSKIGTDFLNDYHNSSDVSFFEYSRKNNGLISDLRPDSYHISLGNECNLACRMCGPTYSSRIAAEAIQLGTFTGPARQNWTENQQAWNQTVDYICNTTDLKSVHLVGGEPLMTPRFEELIDQLILSKKTDIYLGFTTNGTIFNNDLINKLNKFRHIDIGISVECMGPLNNLIRRGSKIDDVLSIIELYLKYRKPGHIYVTLRTVPSALSIHTLDELYKWAISKELDVMTNILTGPEYLQIGQLPKSIKERLLKKYQSWEFSSTNEFEINSRNPSKYKEHIDNEIKTIIKALNQDPLNNLTEELYDKLELWGWFEIPEIRNYFFEI